MQASLYDNLEWSQLLEILSNYAKSTKAKKALSQLDTHLSHDAVESSWDALSSMCVLLQSGYSPPLDDLPDLTACLRAADLGQILEADQLLDVAATLEQSRLTHSFLKDFAERCPPLRQFAREIIPIPKLLAAITNSIGPEGEVLDTASEELAKIRKAKLSLAATIEQTLRQLMNQENHETYLQDKYFTVRSERYVLPIRLDGRGRVPGAIIDTSESGQTLFIEPTAIVKHNENLQDLRLSEKLEIIRIFKDLSAWVSREAETLAHTYAAFVELDMLVAKSQFAHAMGASKVELSERPGLHLVGARHPLLQLQLGTKTVANDISLGADKQSILMISGPNAGGKTVVLKSVGLLHLMAKAGLLIPADASSRIYLYKDLYLSLGDSQDLEASLSTFTGHLLSLKPIVDDAKNTSLVLLDEIAVGTEPQTGSALAQAILEGLAERGCTTLVTTHFDGLKILASADERFRNGSMEFSTKDLRPTYKLILDIPGQSYGLEVAEQLGFDSKILQRAGELRGAGSSEMDQLFNQMRQHNHDLQEQLEEQQQKSQELERQVQHWESQRQAIEEIRRTAAEKMRKSYEARFKEGFAKMEDAQKDLKKLLRRFEQNQSPDSLNAIREHLKGDKQSLGDMRDAMQADLSRMQQRYGKEEQDPGKECKLEELQVGDEVFVVPLGQKALVSRIAKGSKPVEITAGSLRLFQAVKDLRLLAKASSKRPTRKGPARSSQAASQAIGFVPGGGQKRVDVRGHDLDGALRIVWDSIDKAVRSGDQLVTIVHGHGTDKLKQGIRTELAKTTHYALDFRAGQRDEGGDGITIVQLIG